MFTKNWYKALANAITVDNDAERNYVVYDGSEYRGNASGTPSLDYASQSSTGTSMWFLQNSLNTNGGVFLGTGTTPPTINDYCLSGDAITTFTYSTTMDTTGDENGMTFSASYTITNTGDSAFTIGEVALMGSSASSSSYNTAKYKILYERTVLDTPLTIEAGGVGQLTYTIRLNFPTA